MSHGITKEKRVPAKEIDLAVERLAKFRGNPRKYCSTDEV